MSYILDALRRADAERERGRAPDLHARPRPAADGIDTVARVRSWAWLAGGLVVGVALAAWFVGAARDERAGAPPKATVDAAGPGAPALAPPAAAPATSVAPPAAAAPATSVAPPAAAPAASVAPPPVAPAASVAPMRPVPPVEPSAEARVTAPALALPPLPRPVVVTPAPAPARASATPRAGATAEAPPALNELPESIRRELPPLRVGGSVHSEQPAARLLILDGRVLREGERLQPDLVVERIGARDAVLRYRDRAFTLAY